MIKSNFNKQLLLGVNMNISLIQNIVKTFRFISNIKHTLSAVYTKMGRLVRRTVKATSVEDMLIRR